MPAKGTKSTKPKTTKAKSNTVKTSSKTALLSKKIKFNWKIAAVIGVILVAALGYLFVRLSQAGSTTINTSAMSATDGASRGSKTNGQTLIRGAGFAKVSIASNSIVYPIDETRSTGYVVTFFNSTGIQNGNAGFYMRACGRTLREWTVTDMSNGKNLNLPINRSEVKFACGGNPGTMELIVGIPAGFYITGITANQPDAVSAPAPAPGTKQQTPTQTNQCGGVYGEGNQGDCVRLIQSRLVELGYDPGPVDAIYGPKTASAVKVFQSKNGLTQDGVVGPQTWSVLFSANAVRKQ